MKPQNDNLRLAEAARHTGWNRQYIRKLVKAGVLHAWQPYRGALAWYSRAELDRLMNPDPKTLSLATRKQQPNDNRD